MVRLPNSLTKEELEKKGQKIPEFGLRKSPNFNGNNNKPIFLSKFGLGVWEPTPTK